MPKKMGKNEICSDIDFGLIVKILKEAQRINATVAIPADGGRIGRIWIKASSQAAQSEVKPLISLLLDGVIVDLDESICLMYCTGNPCRCSQT